MPVRREGKTKSKNQKRGIGAVEANTDELLGQLNYPHDIIPFSSNSANSKLTNFLGLYQKRLSLDEISKETGFAVSTVRDILARHQTPLRANKKAPVDDSKKPKRSFWGAIPYGYNVLDGKIVVDPREIKVVRKILDLHQKGTSFNAISHWLTSQKIPSKLNKKWSNKSVASIIRRHKNQTDKIKGNSNGT